MPKIISSEMKRENMVTLRLTAEEKKRLISVSKALNLSYTEIFTYSLDFLESVTEKLSKSQNE